MCLHSARDRGSRKQNKSVLKRDFFPLFEQFISRIQSKMDENNYSVNMNCVVSGVFKHRIKKSGHSWQTSPVEICRNNKVVDTACKLCDEFESRYENVFRKLGHEFDNIDLTVESFYSVLDHLLEDGLNWGRITGILTFASVMVVNSLDKNKSDQVELIRDWTCSYLQKNADSWMKQNNGWVGISAYILLKFK